MPTFLYLGDVIANNVHFIHFSVKVMPLGPYNLSQETKYFLSREIIIPNLSFFGTKSMNSS